MSAELGFSFWTVVNGVTTLGLVGGGTWLLGVSTRQTQMESWRGTVDTQIKVVDKRSERSHDAVIALQRDVKHVISDMAEIKKGQKETIRELGKLVSKIPQHMGN